MWHLLTEKRSARQPSLFEPRTCNCLLSLYRSTTPFWIWYKWKILGKRSELYSDGRVKRVPVWSQDTVPILVGSPAVKLNNPHPEYLCTGQNWSFLLSSGLTMYHVLEDLVLLRVVAWLYFIKIASPCLLLQAWGSTYFWSVHGDFEIYSYCQDTFLLKVAPWCHSSVYNSCLHRIFSHKG